MRPRLYLINGPLGAGKTTLLRYLLAAPEFAGARVVENEYAAVSVDSETLHGHQGEIATIAGVCVCCSTGDELTSTLRELARTNEPVLLEATGVANSLRIMERLVLDDVLDRYDLAHAIFVLDLAEASGDDSVEAHRDELLAADTVVLTKADLAGPAATQAVRDALAQLGVATTVVAVDGVVDLALLRRPCGALAYLAALTTDLPDAGESSYCVVDLDDRRVAVAGLRGGWPELVAAYGLRRLKGDLRDETGAMRHVEATPHQLRVTDSRARRARLVFIGDHARAVTLGTLLSAVAEGA